MVINLDFLLMSTTYNTNKVFYFCFEIEVSVYVSYMSLDLQKPGISAQITYFQKLVLSLWLLMIYTFFVNFICFLIDLCTCHAKLIWQFRQTFKCICALFSPSGPVHIVYRAFYIPYFESIKFYLRTVFCCWLQQQNLNLKARNMNS